MRCSARVVVLLVGWGMHELQSVSDDRKKPDLWRLLLRLRPVLRAAGGIDASKQGQGGSDVGGDRAFQRESAKVRNRWFAERAHLGSRLSEAEIEHGVREGILSGRLLCGVLDAE